MRRGMVFASALAVALAAGQVAAAADLALRRVVLSTGGLAYLEHETEVTGNAELTLTVRLDQVDDVLKSVAVYDDAGGVGIVRLPGREPLAEAFRSMPFDQSALDSPVALLSSLQGAVVSITGARRIDGRLLHVTPETVRLQDGATTVRHRVSVATATGIQQAVLEDVESLRFAEPRLEAQLAEALAAVAAYRDRDTRTLSVSLKGEGRRRVRVGYVVEAPIWKTTYRLTIPTTAARGGDGKLQGWAVLENLTGSDWNGVDLTLVAGQPVAFRQAIYTAFFQPRPEVPVETVGRVLPRPDQGDFGRAAGGAPPRAEADQARAAPSPAASPLMRMAPGAAAPAPAPPPAPAQAAVPVEAEDAVAQVLFRYPQPVTIAAGQSAMVPIVDRAVPVRGVALFQLDADPNHPLASVRMTNATGATLPPGVLTLYEIREGQGATYVGDARLAMMPAGEERLVSFAVDRSIAIQREVVRSETVTAAKIAKGVMTVSLLDRVSASYRIRATRGEARDIIIEHARNPDWTLITPDPAGAAVIRRGFRLVASVGPDGTANFPVVLERQRQNTVRIDGLASNDIAVYLSAGSIDPKVKAGLQRIVELRAAVDRAAGAVRAIEQERKDAAGEQERLRANLAAVPQRDPLHGRFLNGLKAQEDRIAGLVDRHERAREAERAARAALADYVASIDL